MDEGVPIWTKWLLSNCWWRNLNHFAKCSKFEQPLHQIVTRREKWSTSAGSGWPRGFSLVVQVSGGALTRTSSVAPSIKIKSNFRGNRVDTIFGAGFAPCSFFWSRGLRPALFSRCFLPRCCPQGFSAEWIPLRVERIASKPSVLGQAMHTSTPTNLIRLSFDLAAERSEDLTPAVYRRLFREHPEAEAMFRREAGDLVKGSMLAMAIHAMIDFAGDRSGSFRMIECEIQSHDAYGTPRKLFGEFFGVIAQTMREILGNDWSPDIDEAWRKLLRELDSLVTRAES